MNSSKQNNSIPRSSASCARTISLVFILLSIFTLTPIISASQTPDTIAYRGVVIDKKTHQPLPFTHLIKNDTTGYITNKHGFFTIPMSAEDTLVITHLSHKQKTITSQDIDKALEDTTVIALTPRSYSIDPITVKPFATYGEFKQAVIKYNPTKQMEKHAANNVKPIPLMQPKKNSFQNRTLYINPHVEGHPSVTIFSVNKNKGILGLINALIEKPKNDQ
jgi:hypothetical protein